MNNIKQGSLTQLAALNGFTVFVTLALIGYSVATVWYSLTGAMEHYTIHVTLVLLLVAMDAALRFHKKEQTGSVRRKKWIVYLLSIIIVACGIYFVAQAKELEFSQPFITDVDFYFGLLLVGAVLGITWITWGLPLALICTIAAVYFAFGWMLPEAVATNRKYDSLLIVSYLSGMGGPRGVLTYAPLSADVIFLLLVFGGCLHGTRAIDMFGEIGKSIGNLFRGGIAYSAITASMLIGMVTGQSVSNIALSGSMTIPTMVKTGFSREEAGAIEVLASTGSQLLPPIMGLGAFLMSVILGVSYFEIAVAAIVPAALYIFAVAIGVACLIGASKGIPHLRQAVDWRLVRWILPSFLVSFTTLIVLLSMRYSPSMAGFWGSVLVISLSFARPKEFRPNLKMIFKGMHEGAMAGAKLATILLAIGIIVQMLVTTGAGLLLGRTMIELSAGNLTIGLLLGMGVALFIGMGLPTPAAYALIAIVVVPSLIDLGLEPLVANFYGFYFAIFSTLTPPVAVGILTAIRISNGSFAGTAKECFKLGGVCFLVPFLFVGFPNILGFPNLHAETVWMAISFALATTMLSAAIYGATPKKAIGAKERVVLIITGPLLFAVTLFIDDMFIRSLTPLAFTLWIVWRFTARPRADGLTAAAED
ncbi:TRAP transporter fused permease subunit [Gammaproteobacteria bacterium]|nr:TRAP transporter fused permease subunit [Gammaproteobacteria bacterium]